MSRLASICLFLVLVSSRAEPQVLSSAPPVSGFVPGQLRSQVVRSLPCERITAAEVALDSLYKTYGYTECTQNEPYRVSLFFVRDTLIAVTAPLPLKRDAIDWDRLNLYRTDERRAAVEFWEQLRSVTNRLLGREPDSVSLSRKPPDSGSSDSTTILVAFWSPTSAQPWEARLTIVPISSLGTVSGFANTVSVHDYCVTTVPWLRCVRRK